MIRHIAIGSLVALLPATASANVVISEFLYDAQGTDADQEFVEIYNSGSATVDLTKWKVNDGSNHTLNVPPKNGGTGAISLSAGSYALLVDNAANFIAAHPGLSGTIIDTVLSLSNTGVTIQLVGEDGSVADSAAYTKDLGAAGDGNSLQKNGSSFIPAAPTPLAANASTPAPPVQTENSQDSTGNSTSNSQPAPTLPAVSSYVAPPEPKIFADAGSDRTVIVGADTEFLGRAFNRQKEDVERVRFLWNFGDGSIADGKALLHHFEYPGKYVVVLTIAENRDAASDRLVVTAEPARLGFAVVSDGSVSIRNDAGRDLDLSRWIIRSFNTSFTLPENSIVLRGETLRIPQKTLGFWSGAESELQYPNGVVALRANESSGTVPIASAGAISEVSESANEESVDEFIPVVPIIASVPEEKTETEQTRDEESASPEATESSQVAAVASSDGSGFWWMGALLFAGLSGAGAIAAKRLRAKEWDIVEEK